MNHIKAKIDPTPAPALRPIAFLGTEPLAVRLKRSETAQKVYATAHTVGKRKITPKAVPLDLITKVKTNWP